MQKLRPRCKRRPRAIDWVMTVKRKFSTSDWTFNVGCAITPEQLASARNHRLLLANYFLGWEPPSNRPRPQPIPIKPPAPAPKRPAVEIVGDAAADPVAAWRATRAAMAEKCGGNFGLAEDLILADQAGGKLYVLAARVHAERESRRIPGMSMRRVITGLNGNGATG